MTDPEKPGKTKLILFSAAAALLSFLLVFGVLEVWVRLTRPQKTYSYYLEQLGSYYAPSDAIGFTLAPNFRGRSPSQEHPGTTVQISINALGLRGGPAKAAKPAGVKRVLCLGDSYTFGVYVGDNETWPSRLEQKLGKGYQVLNAGYADGFNPDQHYAWLLDRGFELKPDLVIYGFFAGNDITEITPKGWRDLDSRGLPRRIELADMWVDHFGRIRSRVASPHTVGDQWVYRWPLLRELQLPIYINNVIDNYFASREEQGPARRTPWGDDPFPFILKPKEDATAGQAAKLKLFRRLVLGMDQACREHGCRFLLLMIPINFQVEPRFTDRVLGKKGYRVRRDLYGELAPWLREKDVDFLNLTPLLVNGPGHYYPENGEVHFNPQGHAFVAGVLAPRVRKLLAGGSGG